MNQPQDIILLQTASGALPGVQDLLKHHGLIDGQDYVGISFVDDLESLVYKEDRPQLLIIGSLSVSHPGRSGEVVAEMRLHNGLLVAVSYSSLPGPDANFERRIDKMKSGSPQLLADAMREFREGTLRRAE